ncbi:MULTISPECIES: hypothetical protein [Stenotrophomonas]|jgi:hypothetical protein|uniref:hypothetical protein n=1 Tax=Stenotrophomonas TaxID=40323 RepID=UPI00201CF457|nr:MULTISPECIES: hypothetical protein [Stenotrophomonas]MBN5027762.1 hypothetical protein [Stenotrophomonas maltophilia]MDH1275987.1 hypothetical protein [Stenotrophomonas sp. GD03937]MDH1485096.1 hypothetical protein [Stenotrophomonas sp. GD03712]UQY95464.1 hypothetical protein LZ605_20475 [Stenotrophomonas maltophilia]WON67889.1 hypothetical protein RWT08_16980 [Stenotrophomonas maltophilia]
MRLNVVASAAVLLLSLAACSQPAETVTHDLATAPADAFLAAIAAHCGQAYEGKVVQDTPAPTGKDPFAGQRLVMHVRGCADPAHELRIPFHVGDDHSRTWVLTRTPAGLRLKHDHRHQDGSADAITLYGGDSTPPGTAGRQQFPADADSVAMFRRADMLASTHNTWAMEIDPDQTFVYELTRPDGRRFRVQFDLAKPVDLPPPPWGDEKTPAQ